MVNLQIYQQYGRIGVKTDPFEFMLSINRAQLDLKQRSAQIIPENTPLQIDLDWSPYWESIGYRGLEAQQRQFNEDAKLTVKQGIGRRAQEGNALGHIEKSISIAQVVNNALQPPERDLELVNIEPARFFVREGSLRWSVELGGVVGDYTAGSVSTEFRYGKVQSYLEQKSSIEYHAVGEVFDSKG
ncbi:hypothetical protein JCM15765_28710 [Paradesulfitobacterium aromaticivorans]